MLRFLVAALTLASLPAQVFPVSLNALTGAPETVLLPEGCWRVSVITGAYNPWGSVSGCNAAGANCQRGWVTWFDYQVALDPPQSAFVANQRWQTPGQAVANAPDEIISLPSASPVTFWIFDPFYPDNIGGPLELLITPVDDSVFSFQQVGTGTGCSTQSLDLRDGASPTATQGCLWTLDFAASNATSAPSVVAIIAGFDTLAPPITGLQPCNLSLFVGPSFFFLDAGVTDANGTYRFQVDINLDGLPAGTGFSLQALNVAGAADWNASNRLDIAIQ